MEESSAMTVAYCIAGHGHSEQTLRLMTRLLSDDPEAGIILHYDQRQGPVLLTELDMSRVHVMRERPIYWGGFELVALQLEMLGSALSLGYNYAVLLSGQDYPLRNVAKLENELFQYDVWASVQPEMNEEGDCTSLEKRARYGSQWLRLTKSLPPKWLRGIDRVARNLRIIRVSNKEDWPGHLPTTFYQRDQLWWGLRSKGPGVS